MPVDQRIEFRVGVHQGDIVVEDQHLRRRAQCGGRLEALGACSQYFSSSSVSGFQCVGGSGLITRFSMPGMRVLADQD
jgi:hypothetical protein